MAATSKTLASRVRAKLLPHFKDVPSAEYLQSFFEILFYASLKTEEDHHIRCDLIWLDPSNPDPSPPANIRADRWRFIPFSQPKPFSVNSLTKIASGSDPRTASFVVFPDKEGALHIWGFIDQALSHERMQKLEKDSGFGRPGLFHARINGIAHISVWRSFALIAELKGETILTSRKPVFYRGEVHRRLLPGIQEFQEYALKKFPEIDLSAKARRMLLLSEWLTALQRLIIRIDGYRHGGAIILSPKPESEHLNIKYGLSYDGICQFLAGFSLYRTEAYVNWLEMHAFLGKNEKMIPAELYLEKEISEDKSDDNAHALEAALWFVSLFSKVDGAIVCDRKLTVYGYGAEILVKTDPPALFLADDLNARKVTQIDIARFGTRHRSMIRYCWAEKDAIGIVLSQDGDIRVMAACGDGVVIWENILLFRAFKLSDHLDHE